ncbi:putative dihydrofolate reductase, Thymidylate synthase [Helianthus anomalus]
MLLYFWGCPKITKTFNQLGCPSWPVPPLLFTETRVRVQAGGILPPSSQRETDSARDGVFTARQHWDVASLWNLVPGDFVHVLGDAHVYSNHVRPLQDQLQKLPRPFPILKINPEKKDIDAFVANDFKLMGYDPHQKIEMKMAV